MSDKNDDEVDGTTEEVVFERRLERRLRRIHEGDRPWLRRFIGVTIILISIFLSWRIVVSRNQQIVEMYHQSEREFQEQERRKKEQAGAQLDPALGPNPTGPSQDHATVPEDVVAVEAFLDVPTANTISECTKGVDAFRLLNLSSDVLSKGEATLDSVFAPALEAKALGVKRQVNLLNIRIRDAAGVEVRMHAVPDGESGKLRTKLFGADAEGLPDDEAKFSTEIEKFRDIPYTAAIEKEFLKLGKHPGSLLETETHEVFTYRDRSGIQVIRSNGKIAELQVFAQKKFLACSKRTGKSRHAATVECKCLDRSL